MSDMEIFVQGEGMSDVVLLRFPPGARVRDIVEAARAKGLEGGDCAVFIEDADEPMNPEANFADAGIRKRSRVHVHRCKRIEVTVNFNGQHIDKSFPPAMTIGRIKAWATGPKGFKLSDVDASEHTLQVCGSATRPDEDVHLGTLVRHPNCSVCFDLVPKQRVEG